MRGRRGRALLTTFALSLIGALSCNDFLTGQEAEPAGPLQITRVTMLDRSSRNQVVFTDTLAPLDCAQDAFKDTRACQSDPLRDRYGALRSPPTPDAAGELRVVFNKLPLLFEGADVEAALEKTAVADLACEGCTGVPPLLRRLVLIGSALAADPTTSPYGPALLLRTDPADKRAALEPATRYRVVVAPGLSGRDRQRVDLSDPARLAALLTFTTEPFKVLQAGTGAAGDPWVYAAGSPAGTAESPYRIAALANNGVIALKFNAPLDDATLLQADSAVVSFSGDPPQAAIPVRASLSRSSGGVCGADKARVIYLWPGNAEALWGSADRKGEIRVTLKDIADLSQAAGHPAGQGAHHLRDLVIVATLSGARAPAGYPGLVAAPGAACAGDMPVTPDLGGAADMATPVDGGRD